MLDCSSRPTPTCPEGSGQKEQIHIFLGCMTSSSTSAFDEVKSIGPAKSLARRGSPRVAVEETLSVGLQPVAVGAGCGEFATQHSAPSTQHSARTRREALSCFWRRPQPSAPQPG